MATDKRIRLVILTDDEIRAALRLRAGQLGEDMSDIATDILRESLAEQIAEVRKRRQQKRKEDGK